MEGKDRWGKGILIHRLLLFLGLLGVMIVMAGFIFSRGDRVVSTAQAGIQSGPRHEVNGGDWIDSLMQSPENMSSQPENR